jgi:DNA sulfur modification protein DndD
VELVDANEAQGFLTQLVPVGVADLFFFDGEKIADLAAEDDSGLLTDSIKQLFGLDIVAKLRTDLDTYEKRQRQADEAKNPTEKTFTTLLAEMSVVEKAVEEKYDLIRGDIDPKISSVRVNLDKLEGRLLELGGSWAMSRDAFVQRQKELLARKVQLEEKGSCMY